jgi:DNA-binding winged helix-turn-helix (wHTH) protein
MQPTQILFPPFCLDPANELLWRDDQLLPLPPKPFAVLRYLIEQRERLVPKAELLHALWPGTVVSAGALKVCVRAIRAALGDPAGTPRFIKTVPGRGYQFIGSVVRTSRPIAGGQQSRSGVSNGPGNRQLVWSVGRRS